MNNLNWLVSNPPAVVNVCRAQALLAAAEAKHANYAHAARALDHCHAAFRLGASTFRLKNVFNCNGYELTLAARAVHSAITLAPHCKQPHQGPVARRAEILACDNSEPYRGSLAYLLPQSCS